MLLLNLLEDLFTRYQVKDSPWRAPAR